MIAGTIGGIAGELLSREQQAFVLGDTSRGLFLRLDCGWVVFLSLEHYRGPLTINLEAGARRLQPAGRGVTAHITHQGITFDKTGLFIDARQAVRWTSPARPEHTLTAGERKARLSSVIQQALSYNPAGGLREALQLLSTQDLPDRSSDPILQSQIDLRSALTSRLASSAAGAGAPLLGLGRGLTPSGDDLLAGVLLALSRWGDLLAPGLDTQQLNATIIRQAYQKTSTLSANLIDCAARGEADERLLAALDGLISGEPDAAACARALAAWGSSSGLDTLAGMALVLSAG